jgi:hypothetical protein
MPDKIHVLTDIPFEFPAEALMSRVRVQAGTDDGREFAALLDLAARVGRPKAMVRECFIEAKGDQSVTLAGVAFVSRALRMNLDQAQRVFAFVATCGHEMDQVPLPADDPLKAFWWDTIKAALLGFAVEHLDRYLAHTWGLGKTATMSPGEGDAAVWPIEQQRDLFAVLGGVEERIGVKLTDSLLMVPNKTRSGIVFATDKDYHTCQLCHRQDCPGRRMPFDEPLWQSIHGP